MLSPCKRVVAKYKTFIAKLLKDQIEIETTKSNSQKLLDLESIIGLHYILLLRVGSHLDQVHLKEGCIHL